MTSPTTPADPVVRTGEDANVQPNEPDRLAEEYVVSIATTQRPFEVSKRQVLRGYVRHAIATAYTREREACAALADTMGAREIADAIRNRKD